MVGYGTSFAKVYGGFCVWNYLTGNRANNSHSHYSEGANYPQTTLLRRIIAIPFDSTSENFPALGNYGTYNLKIVGNHLPGTLQLNFSDPFGSPYQGKIIVDSARNYRDVNFDLSTGEGSGTVERWQNVDSIIFIPANVAPSGNGFLFGYSGSITAASVPDNNGTVPLQFSLKQNFPNPFNPSTLIHYSIPKESFVTLKVFNILGDEISTLVNENKNAGEYAIRWEPTSAQSGVYFYKLTVGNFSEVKKMVLLK